MSGDSFAKDSRELLQYVRLKIQSQVDNRVGPSRFKAAKSSHSQNTFPKLGPYSISILPKSYSHFLDTIMTSEVQFTPEQELIQRYDKERDKRLTKAGLSQYIDVRSKEIQELAKDPWVNFDDPRIQNPPLKDGSSIKFLISGAGHNGLLFGCRLVEAGFSGKDVVCVDIAGGFGGTWHVYSFLRLYWALLIFTIGTGIVILGSCVISRVTATSRSLRKPVTFLSISTLLAPRSVAKTNELQSTTAFKVNSARRLSPKSGMKTRKFGS